MTALNVTRIWIELAVWAAMVGTTQFSLSGSRLMPSPGTGDWYLNQIRLREKFRCTRQRVGTVTYAGCMLDSLYNVPNAYPTDAESLSQPNPLPNIHLMVVNKMWE